jgi:hypothetical protein
MLFRAKTACLEGDPPIETIRLGIQDHFVLEMRLFGDFGLGVATAYAAKRQGKEIINKITCLPGSGFRSIRGLEAGGPGLCVGFAEPFYGPLPRRQKTTSCRQCEAI